MPEGEGPPPQAHSGRARAVACVMWHAPDASLRPELLAALQRPGFSVQACTDPYTALSHVIAAARGEPKQADLVVLVLVEPKQLRELMNAVGVVQRYVPQVVLWLFDSLSTPQLRAVHNEDLQSWNAGVVLDAGQTERAFSSSPQPGKLLTDEELSMLLDEEPKDETTQ